MPSSGHNMPVVLMNSPVVNFTEARKVSISASSTNGFRGRRKGDVEEMKRDVLRKSEV